MAARISPRQTGIVRLIASSQLGANGLLDAVSLTLLERQVLQAYAAGFNRSQIAARIHKSPRRVTHCLTVAKEKLGAASLAQAAVMLSSLPSP